MDAQEPASEEDNVASKGESQSTQRMIQTLDEEQCRLAGVAELIADLPELARTWDQGHTATHSEIHGEVAYGTEMSVRRWTELATRSGPLQACAVVPDLSWIRTNFHLILAATSELFRDGFSARYIFPPEALDDADDRELIDRLVEFGVEVRLSPRLPGWFSIERDSMVCIPAVWGESRPESMVFVYSMPVIAAMQALFDSLWVTAVPQAPSGQGWQTVLDLMGKGRSDEQIAETLGIAIKTVRRRIAQAMSELGVSTRFELGAAWAGGAS